ncbi:MAG: sialidase family protein [Thermoplasmatota archaeon]
MDLKGKRFLVLFTALLMVVPILSFAPREAEGGRPIFQASKEILTGLDRLNVQKSVDMQIGPTGRVFVLYQTMRAYSWDVYLVYSDDDGKTWSDAVRIDDVLEDGNATNDDTNQMNPRMAIGPDGTVYVVWEDWRNWLDDVFSRPVDIRFAKSSDGSSFGASTVITPKKSINTWDAFTPDIAINSDGRLFCVWADEMEAGAYKNIWTSYSTNDGGAWSTPIMINNDGKDYRNHLFPRCAMFGDNVYVTWHDKRNDTMGTKPFLAISRDGGATFQEEFPITTDSALGAHREFASPIVDEAGNLYIVWMDDRTERDEVFFTRSEDGGNSFTQDNRIVSLPDDAGDLNPFITSIGTGKIGLAWEREVVYSKGTERDVYYINSSDGGRSWSQVLRVDDTDRFSEDRTSQKDIVVAYNSDGRALCVYASNWNEDGVVGSYDYNLFFTRHSRSLNEVNHLPELLVPDFLGQSTFDHVVGNIDTLYNFTMTYRDEDNDEPAAGYPRLMIYRDPAGTDQVMENWLVMSKVKGEKDFYYMDGVDYYVRSNVSEEGQFYWKMEINDGVDPAIISTNIISGPLIDMTPPTLEMTAPEEAVWYGTGRIECRVTVRDTGGAGVDNRSIKFMKSIHGVDYFETPVTVSGFTRIDNDTYEAWANISLASGTENFVKFVAKDRVGNGFAESNHKNIWLDPDAPFAVNPLPKGNYVNIYGQVNCSIIWRDANPGSTLVNFTGVDPTSFKYAFRTTSDDFSDWLEPDGYMPIGNESYLVWVNETFADEGVYNFIKWRAADVVGNVMETQGFRITVDIPENYRPVFVGDAFPGIISSPTPHIWWDDAFDEEGDPLYYRVMLLKHPTELQLTGWYNLGRRTYFDIPDDEALDPNYYILRINVTDKLGGWDVMDHVFRVIDTGTPPPGEVPMFPMFRTSNPNSTFNWSGSADHGTGVSYHIRIGSTEYGGDILEWQDVGDALEYDLSGLGLGLGIYSVQIMTFKGGNYSRVTQGQIKINDYSLSTTHPETHEAFKGERGIRITRPIKCYIVNHAIFDDNVTIQLRGELVDENWAYLSVSESSRYIMLVNSSAGRAEDLPFEFAITVAAPEDARRGDYNISYTLTSEDGGTVFASGTILVTLKNAPDEGGSDNFADDLSGVITDILPFLKGLPAGLVIMIFLLICFLVVGGIIFLGIFIAKKREEKKKKDPLAEQRRVYKEIYGREPTEDELQMMKAQTEQGPSVDDFIMEGVPKPEEAAQEAQAPVEGQEGVEEEEGAEPPVIEGELDELPVVPAKKPVASSGDKDTDDLLDRLFD